MTAYEQSMAELLRRVEALEGRRNEHFAEQTARIVAGPPDAAELRRQDRWHATRDAILPAIYAEALNHGMNLDEVLHDAALYADAAHGPLEQEP
jgi:hypothetical protein